MDFETQGLGGEAKEEVPKKKESSQDIYKGQEGVDWEFDETGFPRRIEKSNPDVTPEERQLQVDGEIQLKQSIIEDTKEGINAAREKLGLPPTDEVPPSVQAEHITLGELRQEKQTLINTTGQESSQTAATFGEGQLINEGELNYEARANQALQEIAEGSVPLLRSLKERDAQRLTPLCSQEELGALVANFRMLSEGRMTLTPESVQNVTDTIRRLTQSFERFGVQKGGSLRENSDSLMKLAYGVRTLHDSLESASRKFFVENTDGALEERLVSLRSSLTRLDYASRKCGDFFLRLKQVVSGRR